MGAPVTNQDDERWMAAALRLARQGLGRVWPNPAVGCYLVGPDGHALSRGVTQPGGRPHAEAVALEAARSAGHATAGATAYVTLEPCAHHGKTPPCAEALVRAGIARAVIAVTDPDPRVSGRGMEIMRAGGITVALGPGAVEAREINAGFFLKVTEGRPLVTLKLATSLDGRIALAGGISRWITGPAARHAVHLMRAEHDAILVGSGTVLADDPGLDCRLAGLAERSPVRIVLDARGRVPATARIFAADDAVDSWWVTAEGAVADAADGRRRLTAKPGADGAGLDPLDVLRTLGDAGLTRVLVEGGGQVAASFLKAGLVDRLVVFRAGKVIGGDGLPAIAGLGLQALEAAPGFTLADALPIGDDMAEFWTRRTG